MTRAFTAAA